MRQASGTRNGWKTRRRSSGQCARARSRRPRVPARCTTPAVAPPASEGTWRPHYRIDQFHHSALHHSALHHSALHRIDQFHHFVDLADLKAMLAANGLPTSGGEALVEQRVADGMLFGALSKCPRALLRFKLVRRTGRMRGVSRAGDGPSQHTVEGASTWPARAAALRLPCWRDASPRPVCALPLCDRLQRRPDADQRRPFLPLPWRLF